MSEELTVTTICESPPTFWCRQTSRVIQALFWGGWVCYETPSIEPQESKFTLHGTRAGICECYSHAQNWLFGRDSEAMLLAVSDDEPLTSEGQVGKDSDA